MLCRIPLILESPCVFVLSSGTWKDDFVHNEGQRTIVCVTGKEESGLALIPGTGGMSSREFSFLEVFLFVR